MYFSVGRCLEHYWLQGIEYNIGPRPEC